MKKLGKVVLVLFMTMGLFACSNSSANVEKVLSEKDTEIGHIEALSKGKRRVILSVESDNVTIDAIFNEDKSFFNIGFSNDGKNYYFTQSDTLGMKSVDSVKSLYEEWLKKTDIKEEDLIAYVTDLNKKTVSPEDVGNLMKANYTVEIQDVADKNKFDDSLYLTSTKDKNHMTSFFKDKKLKRFVFANETLGAQNLLVYEDGKVTDTAGEISYMLFLKNNNITHEDFMNYLLALYEQSTKE